MKFDLKFSVLTSIFLHAGFLILAAQSWFAPEKSPLPLGVELYYGEASSPMVAEKIEAAEVEELAPTEKDVVIKKKTPKKIVKNQETPRPQQAGTLGANLGPEGVANGQEVSSEERYLYELKKLLERRKTYPAMAKRMGQTGRVLMSFTLAKDGSVISSEVLEKASYESLNRAADDLIKSIDGVKPFPQEITKTTWRITVPIEYVLN